MQRIGVLVGDRELILVVSPAEMGAYLNQRRLQLVGTSKAALADRLEISRSQVTGILDGTRPFGPKMLARLNALDSEFEAMPLIGIVKRDGAEKKDVDI